MMFKRKIYNKMLEWKKESDGRTALLIEGADVSESQQWFESLPKMNMTVIY